MVSGLWNTRNSATGNFIDSAPPYKLLASMYMIETSSSVVISWLVMVYELRAWTKCVLQNEIPPRILFSNNLYISGVGHSAIGLLIILNADDSANWLMVTNCAPSNPSSLLAITRNCSYTSVSCLTSISKYLNMYSLI